MKISFSKDFGTCNFSIDEENEGQDLEKCRKIERLLKNEDYIALLELFLKMQEKYLEAVMKVKPAEQSFRENAIYSARLNGFWEGVKAPQKVVEAYEEYKKERIKELDEQIAVATNGHVEYGAE